MACTCKLETVKVIFTSKSGEKHDCHFTVKRFDPLPLKLKLGLVERNDRVVLCVDDEMKASVPMPGIANLASMLFVFP